MRVTFLGNAEWSVPSLEALAASRNELALVVTRRSKPVGRGGKVRPTPVAVAGKKLGIRVDEVETVRGGEGFQAIADSKPDVLAVVAYGEILPDSVLALPAVAPINLHFSLLPELRGAAPVQRAILGGLRNSGVTTIRMTQGLDAGPILLQEEIAIGPDEDAGSLGARLAVAGGELLIDTLDCLESGSCSERSQDEAAATRAPKLRPQDEIIDWSRPAEFILRQVRALSPTPGAVTTLRGKRLKVLAASESPGVGWTDQAPSFGSVHVLAKRQLLVIAGRGEGLRLDRVAPEGRTGMTGEEFVNGYRPQPGERLG